MTNYLKVLTTDNKDLFSFSKVEPLVTLEYSNFRLKPGKWHTLPKHLGWVVSLGGLIYPFSCGRFHCWMTPRVQKLTVWECEVGGEKKSGSSFGGCYEKIRLIREVSTKELQERVNSEWRGDYDLYHALWPVNPFEIERSPEVTAKERELFREWVDMGRPSVAQAVNDAVSNHYGDRVWSTICHNLRAILLEQLPEAPSKNIWPVTEEAAAYISSLFPTVEDWSGFGSRERGNPFQSAIDLWNAGLVPSRCDYDGGWGLYMGKDFKKVASARNNWRGRYVYI